MEENKTVVDSTTSSRGAQWATAGSVIALAAQSLLNGGLGSILGGGFGRGVGGAACAAGGDMAVLALSQKDSEIALLKAKIETRDEISQVYAQLRARDQAQDAIVAGIDKRLAAIEVAAPLREQLVNQKIDCCCNATSTALAALNAQVAAITKTVVPKDAICPEVMSRYNSWTAPTTPAAAA